MSLIRTTINDGYVKKWLTVQNDSGQRASKANIASTTKRKLAQCLSMHSVIKWKELTMSGVVDTHQSTMDMSKTKTYRTKWSDQWAYKADIASTTSTDVDKSSAYILLSNGKHILGVRSRWYVPINDGYVKKTKTYLSKWQWPTELPRASSSSSHPQHSTNVDKASPYIL
jgi:hypothetical protein